MRYLTSLRFIGSALTVAVTAVAIAQTTDPRDATPRPDPSYRAGTVPTTQPDANLPVPPRPPAMGGTGMTGASGTATGSMPSNHGAGSVPGRAPTVGGAGPLTTDNGVAASGTAASAASAAAPAGASAPRTQHRPHRPHRSHAHRAATHAASAASSVTNR